MKHILAPKEQPKEQDGARDALQVAALLDEMARRLEVAGVSRFKVRAYENAASSLRTLVEPLGELIDAGKLRSIPGVGAAIADKITSFYHTGTHPSLDELRQKFSAPVVELARIPGVGRRRAQLLFENLNVTTLAELRDACEHNRLAQVKGLGKRVQDKILSNLEFSTRDAGLLRLNRATRRAGALLEQLRARYLEVEQLTIAGDVRRGCELCRGIAFLATGTASTVRRFQKNPSPLLSVVPREQFGAALLFATGSEAHVKQLEKLAQTNDLALTPNGLSGKKKKRFPVATEADVYGALGLPFIEPELREGLNEIAWAQAGRLPRLVTQADLRGALHFHTDASDGIDTLGAMQQAAAERGLEYAGVCDHSRSAHYAGGLSIPEVEHQHRLADELNASGSRCHIFKGIESEITRDGALDYPPEILARFDFVVASIHARFALSRDEQTARILGAVRDPFTTILGHPMGRLLQHRKPVDADWDLILKNCAEYDVAVEINGDPYRMDLDWRWHQRALNYGCQFSIDPDAHDTLALSYLKWGTALARKGGVPPDRILNCLSRDVLAGKFARKKARAMRSSLTPSR